MARDIRDFIMNLRYSRKPADIVIENMIEEVRDGTLIVDHPLTVKQFLEVVEKRWAEISPRLIQLLFKLLLSESEKAELPPSSHDQIRSMLVEILGKFKTSPLIEDEVVIRKRREKNLEYALQAVEEI